MMEVVYMDILQFHPMTAQKKRSHLKLGRYYPMFDGWIIDKHGLKSPEGDLYTPNILAEWHWRLQLMSVLRHRMNNPYQMHLL